MGRSTRRESASPAALDLRPVKRFLKWTGGTLLALLVAGASLAAHTWYFKPLSIDWFYARVFLRLALENPELLTQLRILEPIGIRSHNAKLADASIAHEDRVLALFAGRTRDAASLRRRPSRRPDRLSYDVFDYFVGMQLRGERWRFHNYPVNPLFGVQSDLPHLMTQTQQVNDRPTPSTTSRGSARSRASSTR
jgi:hypothetical protein